MSAPRFLSVPRAFAGSGIRPTSATRTAGAFVCWHCRKRHLGRAYSSVNELEGPTFAGVAALTSRRLISVAGPDATKYLQGVITANVLPGPGKEPKSNFYTGFLSAQGRVLHDVFIYRDIIGPRKSEDNAYYIEVDADSATTLAKHIRRYKLRAKFDVRLLDAEEATVWHAWGTQTTEEAAAPDVIQHHDTRAPGLGWRYVAAGGKRLTSLLPLNADVVDETSYRVHRYLLGVPEGQGEILNNQALPLESNMEFMGAIDFHKGCYVGQELTIRTKHRGVVRKRILPCALYGEGDPVPTQLEYRAAPEGGLAAGVSAEASIGRLGKKGRSVGKWLNGVGNIGLALCRLEPMTDIVLPGETAASTFDPASEFVLKADSKATDEAASDAAEKPPVRIKAFVPDWLRQGLQPPTTE